MYLLFESVHCSFTDVGWTSSNFKSGAVGGSGFVFTWIQSKNDADAERAVYLKIITCPRTRASVIFSSNSESISFFWLKIVDFNSIVFARNNSRAARLVRRFFVFNCIRTRNSVSTVDLIKLRLTLFSSLDLAALAIATAPTGGRSG